MSSTTRPSRSLMTRREPWRPARSFWNDSSMPSWPCCSRLVKPTTCATASPSGYLRLYSRTWCTPLSLSASTSAATGSSTWRRSHTKFGLPSSRSSSSCGVIASSLARRRRCALSASTSFGIAHNDGAGTLDGEQQPVAIDDAAAARRQLERAGVAHLALLLEERRVQPLHVDRAAEQQRRTERHQQHQELGTPRRRFRRQQAGWTHTWHGSTWAPRRAKRAP